MSGRRTMTARQRAAFLKELPQAWAFHEIVLDAKKRPVDYVFLDSNEAFETFTGLKRQDILGKRVTEVIPGIRSAEPDLVALYGQVATTGTPVSQEVFVAALDRWYSVQAFCPELGFFGVVFEDITAARMGARDLSEHQARLEEMVAERTRVIQEQADEIFEMSTPVMRVWDGVVVAPLVGSFDAPRAARFMERLLTAVAKNNATVALVDVTGVAVIDTQVGQHLIETIQAVRLLGATVVLTGIRSGIARTLVHLGVDLSEVETCASLQAGLAIALTMVKATEDGRD